jgi:hypothetical protein
MTQVFHDPYVPPSDDYVPPIISVHSWSNAIVLGLVARMQQIPPFNTAAKFVRSTARPSQAEHIPFVGVYFMEEHLTPLGDLEAGEPRFIAHTKLGFSYIIANNDPDVAADILDAAHWSLMKMFHYPEWHLFPFPHPDDPNRKMKVDGISAIEHDRVLDKLAETPIAEMRMEITYKHSFDFEPVPLDRFELFHMETWPWDAQPGEVKPIITEWVLPQP